MLCIRCNQVLTEDANFCFNCGSPTSQREQTNATAPQSSPTLSDDISVDDKIAELLRDAGFKRILDKDTRAAIKLCHQALALDDTYGEIYVELGFCLYNVNRYQDAIEAFDIAIRLGSSPTARFNVKARALAHK